MRDFFCETPEIRRTNLDLYPPASSSALLVLCAIDWFDSSELRTPLTLLSIAGLAIALGALNGALWQAAFSLTRYLKTRYRLALWSVSVLGAAIWLSASLGAFARIGGRYHQLAVAVIAFSLIGALIMSGLIAGFQPSARFHSGFLVQKGRLVRWGLCSVLAFSAFILVRIDATVYPELYEAAHFALKVCALWPVMFAFILMFSALASVRYLRAGFWAICALLFLFSLVTITESHPRIIDEIVKRPWPRSVLYAARAILDFDRDGYSPLLAGGDCDDFDSNINPQARDIPGNGIDENCFMGDAAPVRRDEESRVSFNGPSPLNVVLITIDALAPSHVGVYEREYREQGKNTTPHLDQWAENAVVFHKAYTAGGWTSIAIGSMLYGRYPRHLKWIRFYETESFAMVRRSQTDRLSMSDKILKLFPFVSPRSGAPLPEMLQKRGMTTLAVVDDEFTEVLSPAVGVDRGFTHFYEVDHLPEHLRNDRGAAEQALKALKAIDKTKSFFLWVHFFGPHGPDRLHKGLRIDGPSVQDRYDHEVRYTDKHLGRLLGELRAYEANTAIFVAADHGEVFGARTHIHGQSLVEEGIRVPLLARVPGWGSLHVFEMVSLIDLVPTILDLTETLVSTELDGISLRSLVEQPLARRNPRILISETWRYDKSGGLLLDQIAAFDGRYKVVYNRINQTFIRYSQLARNARPQMLSADAIDPLRAYLGRYLESTGGKLDLSD
ncbi:MAG: sulfatase-like hydrolase/transferase [Deltaproteobacteria bacterium]|nr:sulfatase-like hydrolase/transferase [Deltaproteobacteria bacterium]